jgi:hypothetical protein
VGEHKHKSTNKRVVFICMDCAYLAGKKDSDLDKKIARWYASSCSICHRDKPVLEARVWGYFTPEQALQARTKLKELGLDRRSFANPEDVQKLVNVVQLTLKEGMSEATAQALNIVMENLEAGTPIEQYNVKVLTYAFTQDVAARQEVAKVKREALADAKPKRKKRTLAVVEGGIEREVEVKSDAGDI